MADKLLIWFYWLLSAVGALVWFIGLRNKGISDIGNLMFRLGIAAILVSIARAIYALAAAP